MLFPSLLAIGLSVTTASAQVYKGFNYGATYSTNSEPITEPAYEALFNAAKNLDGASGFTSARIYTLIQAGTTNTPSDAIQAAINTQTPLLLGLWASAGQAAINNELAALSSAIASFGSSFADLIVGISVGSEDLYRISPTGIENLSGAGAEPSDVANYIGQVKSTIANTAAAGKLVGHVDTWTAWVNSSNDVVINVADFIGMDAYPYFQNTMANSISDGYSLFFDAYDATVSAVSGKPVWVTETGWPIIGATENEAVASTQNAQTYWDQVGCNRLFDTINTWWYTLQDSYPGTPSPAFGVVSGGSSPTDVPTTPLYDLSCSAASSDSTSDPPSRAKVASSSAVPAASVQADGNAGAEQQEKIEPSSAAQASSVVSSTHVPSPAPVSSAPAESSPASSQIPTSSIPASATLPNPPATTLITHVSLIPSASAVASGCPTNLSGEYLYPHLIIPVEKDQPSTTFGTSFNGTITPTTDSIFNFDTPSSYTGQTCSLVFLFPKQTELTSSAFTLSGTGGFHVTLLEAAATEATTYDSVPAVANDFGGPSLVTPGNEYVIASGACLAGLKIGIKISSTGGLSLNYFQDRNPSPIGLYVTIC